MLTPNQILQINDLQDPNSPARKVMDPIYQSSLTLTTTGSSGAATLIGSTLNIPNYVGGGGGSGTVTSVSVTTANGVSGSVLNPTTTPAITFSLGDITPSSVAASGTVTGSNLSGTNTGDQTNVTGNAGTATALQTGRTIAITGDLAYTSPSFNGTSNVTAAGTLATVNSNVGSFTNANITVNAKGLVTAASSGSSGGTVTAYAETPSGTINGSNTVFTLANAPAGNSGVVVILDGIVQYNGLDYTVSGTTITFASAPATGSSIFAYYNTFSSTTIGYPYIDATGSLTMAANTIYYANSASLIIFTLPSTFSQNDVFQVIGKGAGGWRIAQASGQTIRLTSTSTTTGVAGSISSTNRYDNLVLRGLIANTDLSATGRNGTLTVV